MVFIVDYSRSLELILLANSHVAFYSENGMDTLN